MPGWNMPAGCTENDSYFNDCEPEPKDVITERECGCIEHSSDGDVEMCPEHDAEFMAEKGFPRALNQ